MKNITVTTVTLILHLIYASYLFGSIPTSLQNIGNTCYMNSSLQCLYQIKPLNHFLVTSGDRYYKPKSIALEYKELIEKIATGSIISSSLNKFCIPVFNRFFEGRQFRQEDASEFIGFLLDNLVDESVKDAEKERNFIPHTGTKKSKVTDTLFTLFYVGLKTNKTYLSNNDPDCKENIEHTYENILKVGITNKKTKVTSEHDAQEILEKNKFNSLEECLESYTDPEILTGDEQFTCPNGKKVDVREEVKLETCPQYLIISLKRFVLDDKYRTVKLVHPVSFPLKNLDLKPYMANDALPTETKYNLVSFIQQSGSIGGGHYTSYVKSGNDWYYCNDNYITKQTEKDILKITTSGIDGNMTPYILFYERQDVHKEHLKKQNEKIASLTQLHDQLSSLSQRIIEI